jgi:hypothetical protein
MHVPEQVWRALKIPDEAFLCAECVHAIAAEHGINLAWFVGDENYLNDPNWKPLSSDHADLLVQVERLTARNAKLEAVAEAARFEHPYYRDRQTTLECALDALEKP